MSEIIDPIYMPFSPEELAPHFVQQADKHVGYFVKAARRYQNFMDGAGDTRGIPMSRAEGARRIEGDRRFWAATSLKHLYDSPARVPGLARLLSEAFGTSPPVHGLYSWEECLSGDLRLFFQACLPAPKRYTSWLRDHLKDRQLIPYVLDAADRGNGRALEGATRVDALFLNLDNGFSLLVEAKVASDISCSVSFDHYRNEIARGIDVALDKSDKNGRRERPLNVRDPERSLFALLTPEDFKLNPKARFYGWVMNEYQTNPTALERDLPHRKGIAWDQVSRRLGWISYEEIEFVLPGACPWIGPRLAVRAA